MLGVLKIGCWAWRWAGGGPRYGMNGFTTEGFTVLVLVDGGLGHSAGFREASFWIGYFRMIWLY